MFKYLMKIIAVCLLLGIIQDAYGQRATEIFIPVGKSPGLSGKYTTMGTVGTVNAHDRTIVISDSAGSYTIKITDSTTVWLDQSKLKVSNKSGAFADIREDMVVEVKYRHDKPDSVEWIKLQMTVQK